MKLNSNYWDCECEENYIHKKSKTFCSKCGAEEENQPDSHANEVEAMLKEGE